MCAAGHFSYPLMQSINFSDGEKTRLDLQRLHVDYQETAWHSELDCYVNGSYSKARPALATASPWPEQQKPAGVCPAGGVW